MSTFASQDGYPVKPSVFLLLCFFSKCVITFGIA